jgi:hypothetical protein
MPLQIRRGTAVERLAMTQPLAAGELLFVTNEQKLYIGNGSTLGGILVTGYTNGDAQDAAAQIFTSGSHNGINFSYNTVSNIISATVDLSSYTGTINAASFKGSLVADDSTLLVDAVDGKINLDGTVFTNIIPDTNVAYDIGSATNRFKDLYLSGTTIYLGNATITAAGTAVNLPAGSTINGSPIGVPGGDLNVNIVADDSTVIVNTTTEVVTAQGGFVGNLQGNIFTNLIDSSDSSQITVIPSTTFLSDITVDNDLIVSKIILNGIAYETIGDILYPTPQNNEVLPHYVTFVDAINGPTTVKTDGNLRYVPDTEELSVGRLIANTQINSPTINTTNILTSNVQSNGALQLYSNLTSTADTRLVTVGSTSVDGRFQVATSTYYAGGLSLVNINQSHSTADALNFQFNRGRGSLATPSAVQSGDDIADITFAGYDGASNQVRATISASVTGAVSAGVVPMQVVIATSVNGSGGPVTAVTVNDKQQTAFAGAITLATYADAAARNTAIPTPTAGMMVYISGTGKFQGYNGLTTTWDDLN